MGKKRTIAIILTILLAFSSSVYATSSYDLRDYISIQVKNQGATGACWALAMSTVFETNLSLKNNINMQISARHMDYATSQSFKNNQTNDMGFSKEVNTGGTAEIALAYLTNGSGPIDESEMPFSETFGDIDLNEVKNKTTNFQVDKWVTFPNIYKNENGTYVNSEGNEYTTEEINSIRNQIKQHIMENGALYSGIHVSTGFSKYFNISTHSYNCNDYTKVTDHAITIIGWDDNYSRYNFNEEVRPKSDGAYIVQNSWGNDDRLSNGTFYISYEDAIIENEIYGIVDITEKNYTNIYQYDELGRNQYFQVSGIDFAYGANVFERENNKSEMLTQVAISTYMQVDCEVYVNPSDGEITEEKLIKVAEKTIVPGYNTIYLNSAVNLIGNKFAVVVKYKKADDILGITSIARYEEKGDQNPYQYVTSKIGESYIGISLDNMKDLYTSGSANTNICIKAFTSKIFSGDVNGDGKINALDLSLLKIHIVNLRLLEDESYGDINGDGKINSIDLSLLKQIIVNLV